MRDEKDRIAALMRSYASLGSVGPHKGSDADGCTAENDRNAGFCDPTLPSMP